MNLNNEAKAREILARSPWCSQQDALKAWDEAVALLHASPEPWNGEGLPPVGTVCTIECETPHKRWKKHVGEQVVIIAHSTGYEGNPTAVYKVLDAEDSEYHALREQAFRPIRTPEQIAAEERDTAVQEMREIAGSKNAWPFEQLYDAGYRKQPVP